MRNFDEWIKNIRHSRNILDDSINNYDIDDEIVLFALFLRDTIRYISFKELYDIIIKLSYELSTIIKQNNYDNIYFVVHSDYGNDKIDKSDFWILLLTIIEFENEKNIIPNNILNKINIVFNIDKYKINDKINEQEKILFVYFDDMSYSGTQLINNLKNSSLNDISKINENIKVYLFFPFISQNAIDTIMNNQNIRNINIDFFINTIFIDKFKDQLEQWSKRNNKNANKIIEKVCLTNDNNIKNSFECYSDLKKIPIYFEHKIADFMSTFGKTLKFGTYPVSNNELCYPIELINNCSQNIDKIVRYLKLNNKNELCNYGFMDIECPPTYYKTIKYTYKGNILNNYNTLLKK